MNKIFLLLVIYQFKHFLADYPLQGKYMLKKFLPGTEWILPLMAHSGVHAVFTLAIALCFKPELAITLALWDGIIHFTMDRIKASPDLLGRFKPLTAKDYMESTDAQKRANTLFWWALGLDQMVHHLTHYGLIYFMVR
jgi:hypothetical protein